MRALNLHKNFLNIYDVVKKKKGIGSPQYQNETKWFTDNIVETTGALHVKDFGSFHQLWFKKFRLVTQTFYDQVGNVARACSIGTLLQMVA